MFFRLKFFFCFFMFLQGFAQELVPLWPEGVPNQKQTKHMLLNTILNVFKIKETFFKKINH